MGPSCADILRVSEVSFVLLLPCEKGAPGRGGIVLGREVSPAAIGLDTQEDVLTAWSWGPESRDQNSCSSVLCQK